MKYLSSILFLFSFILLGGCMSPIDHGKTLSFWTDQQMAIEEYNMLFANEHYIGDFQELLEDPNCDNTNLLNLKITESEDLVISVKNENGDSIKIAEVNLFSLSTGIKIKPSERGQIFVDQSLEDVCTLIYINWKE